MSQSALSTPLDWLFSALVVLLLIRLGLERRTRQINPLGRLITRITDPLIRPMATLGLQATAWEPAVPATAILVVALQAVLLGFLGWPLRLAGLAALLSLIQTLFQAMTVLLVLSALAPRLSLDPAIATVRRLSRPLMSLAGGKDTNPWIAALGGFILLATCRTLLGIGLVLAVGAAGEAGPLLRQELLISLLLAVRTSHFFVILMILSILSSWFPPNVTGALQPLAALAEPILAPFRRLIPPMGGMDWSPLLAFFLIRLGSRWLEQLLLSLWAGM